MESTENSVDDKLNPVPAVYSVSVEAIVIAPEPFVILTFDPAVRVALVNVLPVELPISN